MALTLLRKLRSAGKHLLVAWCALRHPATPLPGKLILLLMLVYLISPIDLLPDTFPVLGWLDDAALLGIGLPALLKLLPAAVLQQAQDRAQDFLGRMFASHKR